MPECLLPNRVAKLIQLYTTYGIELFNRIEKEDDEAKVCFFTASEHLASIYKKLFQNSPDRFLFVSKPISISEMTKQIKQFLKIRWRSIQKELE